MVTRASAHCARRLTRDLREGQAHWQASYSADYQAFASRASNLWAPRARGTKKEHDLSGDKISPTAYYRPFGLDSELRELSASSGPGAFFAGHNDDASDDEGGGGAASSGAQSAATALSSDLSFGSYDYEGQLSPRAPAAAASRLRRPCGRRVTMAVPRAADAAPGEDLASAAALHDACEQGISADEPFAHTSLATDAADWSVGVKRTEEGGSLLQDGGVRWETPPADPALKVRMHVPGRLVHLFKKRGATLAAAEGSPPPCAPREAAMPPELPLPPFLSRLDPHMGMVDDHLTKAYLSGIRSARATLAAGLCHKESELGDPNHRRRYRPFSGSTLCVRCDHDYSWESTSDSAAQRLMDMHHCRSCGNVVCNACSKQRMALPHLGMPFPERVCDKCFFKPIKFLKAQLPS